jgi:exodeoxyribonuclease-3
MGKPIKIVSWNVNGIRAAINKDFFQSFARIDPDILCLQETKANDDILKEISLKIDTYELFVNSAEKKGYSGTAVFSRLKTLSHSYDIGIAEHDKEGRVITLDYNTFYLVNTYVPNSGQNLDRLGYRKSWDQAMLKYLGKLQAEKPVIFTGDMNVANEPIDLARPKANYNKSAGYTQVEIDGFRNYLSAGLTDTFRHLHKDEVAYTYWSVRFNARAKNVGWRIDYFLVSHDLVKKIRESFILGDIMGSDHCPVGIILEA